MADRRRVLCVALLVVTTALFVIGTSAEKGAHNEKAEAVREEHVAPEEVRSEQGEAEGAHADEAVPAQAHSQTGKPEEPRVFGVDRESGGFVAAAVLVSLGLAMLVWFRPRPEVWMTVAVMGSAFAVLDVDEVRHQIDASNGALGVLATAVMIGHLLAAAVGVSALRRRAT